MRCKLGTEQVPFGERVAFKFKEWLKRRIPSPLLFPLLRLRGSILNTREGLRDARRHRRFGGPGESVFHTGWSSVHLEAQLTRDYHRVEKGLSLPVPRQPFGKEVAHRLAVGLRAVDDNSADYVAFSRTALDALNRWNIACEIDKAISTPITRDSTWGPIVRAENVSLFEHFFTSRRSVRGFAPEKLDMSVVRKSVGLAINTPSVCNRQAFRVHAFTDRDEIESVLSLQNGNRGFRETVPVALIITVDARKFAGPSERNQRWVDGGMFAMTLGWALHAMGVASCYLNWSMTSDQTAKLRRAARIPEHEDVVTLMAIGWAPDVFRVARSPRRALGEVLQEH